MESQEFDVYSVYDDIESRVVDLRQYAISTRYGGRTREDSYYHLRAALIMAH